ncbi:hypothetical protein AgCh_026415 [Apium graveolens]
MQLKCLSKSWLSLINTIPPPSGLFMQRPHDFKTSDPVCYFPLRDMYNDIGVALSLPIFCNYLFGGCGGEVGCHCPDSRLIRILDSSHGLLLCSDYFLGVLRKSGRDHYVYNPTTNQLATLPRRADDDVSYSLSMSLAFHPSNSPHYKVIACAKIPQSELKQFEIYSSETKSWRVSGQHFTEPVGIRFTRVVYCNGSVYWISDLELEANGADCLFFNLNEERLEKFPKPPIRLTSSSRRGSYFGKSEEHLHFIEVGFHAISLHVYELKCDHSGWFVKYQIDLAQLSKAYPQKSKKLHDQYYYKVAVLSLIRRDKYLEDDSFVVFWIYQIFYIVEFKEFNIVSIMESSNSETISSCRANDHWSMSPLNHALAIELSESIAESHFSAAPPPWGIVVWHPMHISKCSEF